MVQRIHAPGVHLGLDMLVQRRIENRQGLLAAFTDKDSVCAALALGRRQAGQQVHFAQAGHEGIDGMLVARALHVGQHQLQASDGPIQGRTLAFVGADAGGRSGNTGLPEHRTHLPSLALGHAKQCVATEFPQLANGHGFAAGQAVLQPGTRCLGQGRVGAAELAEVAFNRGDIALANFRGTDALQSLGQTTDDGAGLLAAHVDLALSGNDAVLIEDLIASQQGFEVAHHQGRLCGPRYATLV